MNNYKPTIGIEIHLELKTNAKAFSLSPNNYNSSPNTNINEIDLCEDVSQSMETFNILVYKNLDNEYNFIRDKKTNIKNRQKFKLYNVFKVNDNGIKMKNDLYKKLRGIKLKLSKYKF